MKNIAVFMGVLVLAGLSCKTRPASQKTNQSTVKTESVESKTEQSKEIKPGLIEGKTLGTISHKYRESGCSSVILVKIQADNDNVLVLIPNEALPAEIDKEGVEIYFDYLPLKRPQPDGCPVGIPAEIANIIRK